jgi:hypothetical protein
MAGTLYDNSTPFSGLLVFVSKCLRSEVAATLCATTERAIITGAISAEIVPMPERRHG